MSRGVQPTAAWFLQRLIAFRPWLWGPNAISITLFSVLETVPGLLSRSFFDWLSTDLYRLDPLWWILSLLGACTLGRVACLVGCQLTNAPFMYTSAGLLQRNLMQRLLQLPGAAALPHPSGEAVSRFRDDVEEASTFLIPFNDLVAWFVFAGLGLLLMLSVSPTITLAVFVPLAAISAVIHLGRRRIEGYRRAVRNATANVSGYLADVLSPTATHTIQTAAVEDRIVTRFEQLNQARLQTAIRDRLLDQVLRSISQSTANLGTGAILLLAAQAMAAGTFTVGDLALFVFYLGWIGQFTATFGLVLARCPQVGVSFARMVELLQGSRPHELVRHRSPFSATDLPRRVDGVAPLEVLHVEGLSFAYPGSGRGIHRASFTLHRGECLVITGRIGSGKTTLLRVLLGLLPRQAGTIRWNGELVDDPATLFVPPRCAYTPQLPRLFSDSLRGNILLGSSTGTAELEPVIAATQLAADVADLQDGLDTPVGPRGVALSGGQVQRAAAARMLVRNCELLVLDDLSSLDAPTEAAFWSALRSDPSRTIIAVSHRPAVLARADRVLHLRDGRVAER